MTKAKAGTPYFSKIVRTDLERGELDHLVLAHVRQGAVHHAGVAVGLGGDAVAVVLEETLVLLACGAERTPCTLSRSGKTQVMPGVPISPVNEHFFQ